MFDDEEESFADAERRLLAEANEAERNRSMIDRGRRIGGLPGAMVAGAMIAVRDIYEGPKRDDAPVVVDAPSEPHDIDRDGVPLEAAEIGGAEGISVPAQPRLEPVVPRRRSRRR
jgi:hypothetical protein